MCTIPNDNYFLQVLCVFRHFDGEGSLCAGFYLQRVVAYIADLQDIAGRCLNDKLTVQVCDCTVRGPFDHDVGSDDRFPFFIGNNAVDRSRLSGGLSRLRCLVRFDDNVFVFDFIFQAFSFQYLIQNIVNGFAAYLQTDFLPGIHVAGFKEENVIALFSDCFKSLFYRGILKIQCDLLILW